MHTIIDQALGDRIAIEAQRWWKLHVPYNHRGCSIKGADCAGFIIGVMKNLGYLNNFHLPNYGRDWQSGAPSPLLDIVNQYAQQIENDIVMPGDLVLFSFSRRILHVGIYIGKNLFVHLYQGHKVKIDTLMNSSWTPRWTHSYRFIVEKI